jgi:hypothetical protein
MRDTILICHLTKWFVVLHHAMDDRWPVFRRNSVVRLSWPWSPFTNKRRRTGVMGFIVGEQLLHLEIQCTSRGKEEVENW